MIDYQLQTVDMMLNMGPQHPATHGLFRMVLTVDGERIVDCHGTELVFFGHNKKIGSQEKQETH